MTPKAPKELIDEVTEKTGLTLSAVAEKVGLKEMTLKKIRWGDVKLTDDNRTQLQTLLQNYSNGRPLVGVRQHQQSHQPRHQETTEEEPDPDRPPQTYPAAGWERIFDLALQHVSLPDLAELLMEVSRDGTIDFEDRSRATQLIASHLGRLTQQNQTQRQS